MSRPIADLFFENVARFPEREAVYCDGALITYAELGALVNRYSNFFFENGIKSGDHIGVPLLNNITSAALIMTACNTGIGLVPINPSLAPAAVNTVFASGDVSHVIGHKAFLRKMDGKLNVSGRYICSDGEFPGALSLSDSESCPETRPEVSGMTGDETLVLIMTSGSTGDPKPVDMSQNCKFMRAQGHFRLYGLTSDDIILAGTPVYHTLAFRLTMLPLMLGGTSVILPRFSPENWMKTVQDKKVTFTIAVSSQLAQISELIEEGCAYDLGSLRCIVSSSSWLEPKVKEKLIEKMDCEFHEIYGTSETASPTDIDFRDSANKQKSVGKCIPGARIRIRREDGSEADTGEIGEITVDTPQIFKGYYKRPELNETAFDGRFFRTGDLGYVDGDGFLYFSGRLKEMIVSGGVNTYPQDIETVILAQPKVRECAAFGIADERLGEAIAVMVAPKPGETLTEREVAVICARNLADYQQPRKIIIVDEIPKNHMGKISRVQLSALY